MSSLNDASSAFIVAACVPRESSHASGTLAQAESILTANPEVATGSVHVAAILGDDDAVRRFLRQDCANATSKGGPYEWDALTHLCFSRYLRLHAARSDGFVRAAAALLDAGASANTGWFEQREWESALYGAAGIAHHEPLTRLLLERGADPNDGETPYHVIETRDNGALRALVESGRCISETLSTMLLRKADWHDHEGIAYLLANGADPNAQSKWRYTALHQALRRDNDLNSIDLMLDHGADPTLANDVDGRSALSIAVRRGRADVLASLVRRRIPVELHGVERLIAACARGDTDTVRTIAQNEPELVRQLIAVGGTLLGEFAATANAEGIGQLLDLGVPASARYEQGDSYFGIARHSTALHVAAWRSWPAAVRVLIDRGAPVDVLDGEGRSALQLAVRACVEPWWSSRCSPDTVKALLDAGAVRRE